MLQRPLASSSKLLRGEEGGGGGGEGGREGDWGGHKVESGEYTRGWSEGCAVWAKL